MAVKMDIRRTSGQGWCLLLLIGLNRLKPGTAAFKTVGSRL